MICMMDNASKSYSPKSISRIIEKTLISERIFVTFFTTTRKVERWLDVGANFPKKEYLKRAKRRG